jgi:hypothetical protein
MGVSERLYESACECRDLETRLDRLARDLRDKEELLAAHRAAAMDLVGALQGHPLPAGAAPALSALRRLGVE